VMQSRAATPRGLKMGAQPGWRGLRETVQASIAL
jgi:hypothetical protein